jgi:hypothetical protein
MVYTGPSSECSAYFDLIGFKLPRDNNPADFFLAVMSGSVPSAYDPAFKSQHLFDYWERYCLGGVGVINESYLRNHSAVEKSQSKKDHILKTWGKEIAGAIWGVYTDLHFWVSDVGGEIGRFSIHETPLVFRETCSFGMQVYLCFRRCCNQRLIFGDFLGVI